MYRYLVAILLYQRHLCMGLHYLLYSSYYRNCYQVKIGNVAIHKCRYFDSNRALLLGPAEIV